MNKIYTYISRKTIKSTIGRFLAGSFGHHPKTALLFVCLAFFAISAPAQAQVTLSGTIYSDAGTTPDATSRAIRVAVGTSTPGVFASSSMTTSGAYTVTIGAGNGIATGTPIMVWIDGGAVLGSVVTKASSTFSGANITGLDIYRNRLITRHEATSATSTTINDLSFYTIGQDADVTHATTSNGEIVVRSGVELYVWSGDTFAPGGAVTVAGNGGAGATEGSMTMAASSVYTAGGNLRLAGSLSVPSTATFNAGSSTIFFVASTTGKTISAPVTSIGNVTFVGNGGGWAFTSSATTSDFTILVGSVTAPSTALAVRGTYQNYGTFDNNGGKLTIIGAPTIPTGNFPAFTAGLDASGSAAGTGNLQINHLAVSGNGRTLYAAKAGSATACSQTAGSAIGCELMVFDIANTSAPAYVAGRDVSGNSAGYGNLAINYLTVVGNYLYAAKAGNTTACLQIAGSATGCELMVFDISSTTNPIYVAGRDMDGTATGVQNIAALSLAAKGTSLYVAKAASGATACSTTALNCELMVFDISSTTNPTYQTGRDASGSAGGTQTLAINSLSVIGNLLVAGKAGSATACSQTAGSAVGCELMIFDVASTTNPTYVAGRDTSGDSTGVGNLAINFVTGTGTLAYVAKAANATACSQTAGSALGCEIMAFDLTSSTSPLYVRGVDVSGSETGQQSGQVSHLHLAGNYLYANTAASASICKQSNGLSIGCELVVFDVSSSTALRHITGRDVSGSVNGVQSIAHTAAVSVGNMLFVSRGGSATACSQTAGSTGAAACELAAFSLTNIPQGILMGSLTGSNALGAVVATGTVEFRDNATTSDLTVAVGTTTLPSLITVTGDFQNNANLVSPETTLKLDSSFAQSIGGNLVGTNELYTLHLSGNGSKTFSSNASTTFFTIDTGVSVTFPSLLSVSDTYTNSGTVDAGSGTLNTDGYVGGFLSGVSAGGSLTDAGSTNINSLVRVGSFVFAAKSNSNTACSQTAGSAVGCELMVFNIESQTAPSYRAGRDGSGNAAGTGNITTNHLAVSSNNQTLYVAKGGDATACSQTAGSAVGCELMVFDIASSTNPTYVAGRDANGNTVGTGNVAINYLLVSGNYLYVAKAGSATVCTQSSSTASGCELMVFDISSTTNPVFVASRDMDGTTTGVQNIAALSLAASGTSLYVAKAASGGTACSTTALNCELMVFDISSTTNPTYQTGRDASGSAGGTQTLAINTLTIMGNALVAGKAGSATACSQSAGSAVGCELMVFDISSTTNPTYISGQDVSGSAAGTGNLAITFVTSTGTIAYVGKAANVTNCSQDAGAGIGCELMAFDISSTTNPLYVRGLDASLETNGDLSLGIQTVLAATSSLLVGKLASALPCEQLWNLRTGCELLQLKMPTTMNGTMTGASRLNNLTTLGLTEITTNASTSDLTIASSSIFTAPSTTLSLSGNFTRAGEFRPNQGTIALLGTNQTLTAPATTTFYNLTQTATTAATTTFSTSGTWQVANNLTLTGSGAGRLALRSATDGVQWTILPLGSTSVSYVNVKDSRNSSTTFLNCLTGCTDAGNNTGWSWPAAPENVWNANDWVLYDTLTISEANIRSDLTDFPVYVNLDDLSPIFWATTPTSSALAGTDIRVTTEADVEVPRELVFASTTTQKGELHFKAPYLSSTTDTVFKIWYNGTTSGDYADSATYGAENVWTNGYVGVWHMNESPGGTAPQIIDSTTYGQDATATGSMNVSDLVTGRVGSGLDFASTSSQYLSFAAAATVSGSYTVSAWAKPADTFFARGVFTNRVSDENTFDFKYSSGTVIHGDIGTGTAWLDTTADQTLSYTAGSWHHTAYSVNTTGYTLYVDNNTSSESFAGTPLLYTSGNTPRIGTAGTGARYFTGVIDEFRIASTTRTAAWISAEYTNQATQNDFYSVAVGESGSSTITNHVAGQVSNAFNAQSKTNESLFAFRLQPNTGTTTVTQIIFSLSGVVGVSSTDFTNIRLLRDLDSDGQYDAGDVAVGGAGIISLLDQAGTITFDGDFLSTTTQDYIVVADWNAPANGSFITINLYRENITIINGTVETIPVVSGTTGSPTTTSNVTYQGMTGTTYQWGTSGGTITFSGAGTVYPLIVAGGGAGGVGNLFERGGGGGAGGMVGGYPSHPNYSFPATASSYTINVGVGGVPSTTSAGPGTNGSNSSIVGTNAPPAAIGGGGGGTQNDGEFGQDGGSGGGGTFSFAAGNGTTSQGNAGSLGIFGSVYGGGGGGAGQRGEAQKVADQQLAGGAGLSSTITGTLVYYAGGGGGTIDNDGRNGEAGGIGGGGSAAGLTYAARSGTDGLGGGGAPGTTGTSDSHRAGKGGDGTVILFVPSVIPVVQQQISGSVTFVQHSRNNKGGGGSGASIGDPAPAGDGDVGGGGDTGGEVIGNDPDYFWPSSHSGSWTNGASAYDQTDGTYATTNSGANHQYADHSLVVPGSNTIQGIIIKLELSGTTGAGTVDVQLSWDGGSSWTSAKSTPTLSTTDAVYTLGSPSDLWGRSWSTSDFSNANFRIRVIGNVSSNTIRLDAVQVRVYHTAGGGGGGGGGAI